MYDYNLLCAVLFLRLGIGLLLLSFGMSQISKPKHWLDEYVPGILKRMLLLGAKPTMRMHALVNIILALLLFSGWHVHQISILTWLWLLTILPFAFWRSWKTGMRDLAINLAALALAFLVR